MLQKTYHITDFSDGSLEAALAEVAAMDAYQSAAQVLAVFFEQNWDTGEIERQLGILRQTLPKAEAAGVTHFHGLLGFEQIATLRCFDISFLFFEQPAFSLRRIPLDGLTDAEGGARLSRAIHDCTDCKGVMLFCSELGRNVDTLLAEAGRDAEDVPIFGATAGLYAQSWGNLAGYVFDADGVARDTLLTVLFHGENLRVKASCSYGWTPVGKTMTITGMDGDFRVTEIDGRPAMEVYRRYLGLTPALLLIPNVCEFPLIVDRDGLTTARIPLQCEKGGRLRFGAPLRVGEQIRFSYGAQQRIFSEVYRDAESYLDFTPQGMFLSACMNRLIFLKDAEEYEIGYYRQFAPQLAVLHGNSELYRANGAGGDLNSALVAVGIREGEPEKQEITLARNSFLADSASSNFMIPLEYRVMTFLSAVTEDLEDMTRRADAANRAKSAFLSSMTHEIRTPINAVLGMDEMISREATEENILEYAENIRAAGSSLLGLVNDVLDFSKIEAGKMDILPVEYETASMLNDLVSLIRKRAEDKGLTLAVEADEALPAKLYGDELRVKQIVTNILTNAVKYTERGGVTLRVSAEPSETPGNVLLCVSVRDTGIGIKPEDMQKLFSAFERIEEKRNRNVEGTGLGMSITQRLLAMMGSKLDVESVYGEGSTFSFRVEQKIADAEPMGDFAKRFRQSVAARGRYRESFTAREARILVVDDTPVNLTVIRGLLKKTMLPIDTAGSGQEALAMAEKTAYDVILIDHMMPEMDGVETLRRLRALPERKNVPCIALTGNVTSDARERYMRMGFSDYLSKPIDGRALEALLLEYLPPDKVRRTDSQSDNAAHETKETPLPAWLYGIGDLDTQKGLSHCGTVETYLDTLTIYANNAPAAADELEGYWRKGDIENTTVKVHALKSISRAIGAEKLGALAEKLETAGKTGDTGTLSAEIGGLLADFRALGTALVPLRTQKKTETEKVDLPMISGDELREAYDTLRELAVNLDADSAKLTFAYLDGFRLPKSERGRVEALRRAIAEFDWDKVETLLG